MAKLLGCGTPGRRRERRVQCSWQQDAQALLKLVRLVRAVGRRGSPRRPHSPHCLLLPPLLLLTLPLRFLASCLGLCPTPAKCSSTANAPR